MAVEDLVCLASRRAQLPHPRSADSLSCVSVEIVMLEMLAGRFETGSLQIAHDLPLRADLMAEIASLEPPATLSCKGAE